MLSEDGPVVSNQAHSDRHTPLSPESYDILHREFQANQESYKVSPSNIYTRIIYFPNATTRAKTLMKLLRSFAYCSYDSIEVRITMSSPKSLVGALMTALFPQYNPMRSGLCSDLLTSMTTEFASMCEVSQCVPLGTSNDILLKMPWTFRSRVIPTTLLTTPMASTQPICPGMPTVFIRPIQLTAVGTTPEVEADIRVYFKFVNMQLYGPVNYDIMLPQASVVAGAATAVLDRLAGEAVRKAASYASDKFCESTGLCNDEDREMFAKVVEENSSFLRPSALMPSIFGDTVTIGKGSIGIRGATPLMDGLTPAPGRKRHRLDEWLREPQYLGYYDHTRPFERFTNDIFDVDNSNPRDDVNWFVYFGNAARYWSGSINVHFQVCGHPMIEVEFSAARGFYTTTDTTNLANYPSLLDTNNFNDYHHHREVFSGSKVLTVNLPLLSGVEYVPCQVSKDPTTRASPFTQTTFADVKIRTLSSAIGPVVQVPVMVFISAGDDFAFYDQRPPNAYVVPQAKLTPQETHEHVFPSPIMRKQDTLMPITYIEDFLDLWAYRFVSPTDQDYDLSYPANYSKVFSSPTAANIASLSSQFDPMEMVSRLFLCWRGSISYKVLCDQSQENRVIAGLSYADPGTSTSRTVEAVNWPVPYKYSLSGLEFLNPGCTSVFTDVSKQPVLEFPFAYRGSMTLSHTDRAYDELMMNPGDDAATMVCPTNPVVHHNFTFWYENDENEFHISDRIWRKAGSNMEFHYRLPPPQRIYWRGDHIKN